MAIGVAYHEMAGFPQFSYRIDEGFRGRRRLKCAWGDKNTVAAGILAYPDNAFPTEYGWSGPVAVGVQVTPFGKQEAGTAPENASYDHAVVDVEYSDIMIATSDYVTEMIQPTNEVVRANWQVLKWGSGGAAPKLKADDAPVLLLPSLDYIRIYHKLAAVPAAVNTLIRCVNNATVNCIQFGLSFPAETLLYQPPQISRRTSTGGSVTYSVTLRFKFKPNYNSGTAKGWNWFWRDETQQYEQIYTLGDVLYKPYLPATFSALWS